MGIRTDSSTQPKKGIKVVEYDMQIYGYVSVGLRSFWQRLVQ